MLSNPFQGLDTYLFVQEHRPRTVKGPFQTSSQADTCYYQSNHLTVEVIPLSVLRNDTISELAGLFSH